MATKKPKTKKQPGNFFEYILNDEDNIAFVPTERSMYDIDKTIDTGIYGANAVFSDADIFKGIALGKRYVMAGESATAKSFITLTAISNFLAANPKNKICYFESEGALLTEHLKEVGVDRKRFMVIPTDTIEFFRTKSLNYIDKWAEFKKSNIEGGDMLVVLDSLGMLVTIDEQDKSESGVTTKSMSKPQLIASTFRQLAMKLAKNNVAMIIVQHVHNSQGGGFAPPGMAPKKIISGGETLKFVGDVILRLSKSDEYDKSSAKGLAKFQAFDKIGIKTTITVEKSRFMKSGVKFPLTILYGIGILKHSGLLQHAVDAGIITQTSNWYTNTINSVKFQKSMLVQDPDKIYCKKTLQAIRDHIYQKYSLFNNIKHDVKDLDPNDIDSMNIEDPK